MGFYDLLADRKAEAPGILACNALDVILLAAYECYVTPDTEPNALG